MPNPVDALYNLFRDPVNGLKIVADDRYRVISADPQQPYIDVRKDPYAQEGKGDARPQVIIGPVSPVMSDPHIGYASAEVHVRVEVRIITRDWDMNDMGFTLSDGQKTGDTLRDAITTLIEANKSNPGKDGTIIACWISGAGQDRNMPEGPPKYLKTMQIEFMWLQ